MPSPTLAYISQYDTSGAGAAIGILIVVYAAIVVLFLVGWVKILGKAGYSGWWVLIGFVPLANLVMFLVFAFSEWPVVKEVRGLRASMTPAEHRPPWTGTAPLPPPPPAP